MTVDEAQFHLDVLEFVADMSDVVDEHGRSILGATHSSVLPNPKHLPAIGQFRARVHEYLDAHPGTLQGPRADPTYSLGFLAFILELLQPGEVGEGLSYTEICAATGVPLATLLQWFQHKPYRIRGLAKQRSNRRKRS